MASQFQNRVVGAVVLVALGVIILPGIFDGNKMHYQSEFASIPLIPPVPESDDLTNTLPPAIEPLPDSVIPEPTNNADNSGVVPATENTTPPSDSQPVADTAITAPPKTNPPTQSGQTQVPQGKAYVIQLGALTNAAKVEEIKATLSFANYTVYTVPAKAVQGKTTRIFVGPDASKQKLEASLPALEKLTGLKGVVREHKVTN